VHTLFLLKLILELVHLDSGYTKKVSGSCFGASSPTPYFKRAPNFVSFLLQYPRKRSVQHYIWNALFSKCHRPQLEVTHAALAARILFLDAHELCQSFVACRSRPGRLRHLRCRAHRASLIYFRHAWESHWRVMKFNYIASHLIPSAQRNIRL